MIEREKPPSFLYYNSFLRDTTDFTYQLILPTHSENTRTESISFSENCVKSIPHTGNKFVAAIYMSYPRSCLYAYTLFDGSRDNTRGYFTSCVVFSGLEKMRAMSKISARIIP